MEGEEVERSLDAALADPTPEHADPANPEAVPADPHAGTAEHARRLAQAAQALAAVLDEEPAGSPPADDAEG